MILTVTLNAAVDRTYRIEGFALDRVHRPSECKIVAGGKGINVSRVYRTLGGEAVATGFLGGDTGHFVEQALKDEGLEGSFVRTREPSRICIAVVDPLSGSQTEVNEVGPTVTSKELSAFQRHYKKLLREQPFEFVTISGSIPPGVPDSIYTDLIEVARREGVRAILDASGEPLRLGVAAKPWMVKPNIHELSGLLGAQPSSDSDIIDAARDLLGKSPGIVCVTRGGESVLCHTASGTWRAAPPKVDLMSAVGSGDAFLAAFIYAIENEEPVPSTLQLAVGAGAANAAEVGAGFCSGASIRKLAAQTVVEAV